MTTRTITLPLFGALLAAHGGHFGAVLRGAAADGSEDYALIVAPAASAGELIDQRWGEYGLDVPGAASQTDGPANTAAMAAAGNALGSAVLALDLEGHTDWYLPAAAELRALQATVPELFEKRGWYWSSTPFSRLYAWCQDFEYGSSYHYVKYYEFRARAVRRIPLHTFNA